MGGDNSRFKKINIYWRLIKMDTKNFDKIFTEKTLKALFPDNVTDNFFDALLGDASEGAYNISLVFKGHEKDKLFFEFHLKQRPDKCLACNLTYGLPEVFLRHPIININGLVQNIKSIIGGYAKDLKWQLQSTVEISRKLHIIPMILDLK